MIIDHCYYVSDLELLEKYGIKPFSDECELADQSIILYSFRKGLPIPGFFLSSPSDSDSFSWKAFSGCELSLIQEEKKKQLLESGYHANDPIIISLMEKSSLYGPVTNNYQGTLDKLESIPQDEFDREYAWLLITMFERSRLWKERDYCSFEIIEKIKKYLDGLKCDVELGYFENGVDFFTNAVFGELEDTNDSFSLLLRDALPEEYIFKSSQDITCEKVLIEGDGWGPIRYEERYDDVDKIIVPTTDTFECDLVKMWMEYGLLSELIDTLCISLWKDRLAKIAVLDCYNSHTGSVVFQLPRAEEFVEDDSIGGPISYEDIALQGYSLDSRLYKQPENKGNLPLYSLGELCEIDTECQGIHSDRLPYYDFTNDFSRLCANASHPRMDKYYGEITSTTYEGPHVHIRMTQGSAFISRTPGPYHCQRAKNIALRIKDNLVFDEYLALILTTDFAFQNYIQADPPKDALLRRKIAILPNRAEQEAFVKRFIESSKEEALSNNFYNLLWIDPTIDIESNLDLALLIQEKQMCVQWLRSVSNPENGLESYLKQQGKPVHAVIMEADVESKDGRLKGLRQAMRLCKDAEVPIYTYTHLKIDDLALDLEDEQYGYLSKGRYFSKDDSRALRDSILAIRKELDNNSDVDTELRSHFRNEFLAAEWFDENFTRWKLHLSLDLSTAIKQPNKSFNLLRGTLRGLYRVIVNKISNGTGLENLDLGAIPALLDDKSYRDDNSTKMTFILRGNVIPKTLARSLRLATDIVNGGSHSETIDESQGRLRVDSDIQTLGTDNLAWAVIRIVMDFILYLRNIECQFDGYCESFDPTKPELVQWVGTVKKAGPKEYYCETDSGVRVHLLVDPKNPLEVNQRICIRKLYREGKFIDRYQWLAKRSDCESLL